MPAMKVDCFFEKVAESKPLQAKLKTLQKKLAKDTEAMSAAALVKIASAAGFKFTAKDFLQASKAKAAKRSRKEMPEVVGQYYCPYGLGTGPGNYW